MNTQTTLPDDARLAPEAFAERAQAIEREIGQVIVGQAALVRQTLTGMLANSHVLLEGVPGLGKTMLVRTIADVIDCSFSRIQFTPDLMPADITGTNILIEEDGKQVTDGLDPQQLTRSRGCGLHPMVMVTSLDAWSVSVSMTRKRLGPERPVWT